MSDENNSKSIKSHGGRRPGAGRPGGSPNKLTRPLKEAAALESEACLQTLVHLRDHSQSDQVRLSAATAILDRGHGRPRQEVNLTESLVTIVVNKPGTLPIVMSGPENVPLVIEHQPVDTERPLGL